MLERAFNRLSLAGLCATLIGNGIGRFAFIAMMPALIQAGWFSKADASYLGVATLVGYVAGAAFSDALARRFSSATLLRISMLVCSLSFFACAIEGAGLPWYYLWRTAAGACGAVLMVLPAPVVLPQHDPSVRGRASGVVFSGIGLGAALSGSLVPLLIAGIGIPFTVFALQGVTGAWLGMGAVCLALTLFAWRQWPVEAARPEPTADSPAPASHRLPDDLRMTVWLIMAAHGLNAIGYLTHTMFWVDYVVRELGMPLATGGMYWALFGLGAAIGPMLTGSLADRFGLKPCLIAGFVIKAFSALLPVLNSSAPALIASSVLMGIFTPGIVALVSAYSLATVGQEHHRKAWGMATSSFAVAQAGGGALMAFAASMLHSYHPLFVVSALALIGSVGSILLIRDRSEEHRAAAQDFNLSPPVETAQNP
ncbi:YbfB/YjiJ family MFS transporter [Piscinibacter terrae]|uniref:YbfB/YjiJ family MFS transporter n=1 Tax=Piscinibacter terrae TaxID=2496871 RepID=A0A3N7JXN3_9BURK|nr:YbfB/YjiJ family MFS transporter [Albitalea terrae]RQP25599.1 YbfB/YjiJ family MFS transporter [Albitalea terrae]